MGDLGQPQQKTPPAVTLRMYGFNVKPQESDHMAKSSPFDGIAATRYSTKEKVPM